jgi:hypothetical protein
MPWLEYGRTTRTHRVRPSEKTAHRVISGPFSGRPSRPWLAPRRGGLRTPVKATRAQPRRVPAKGHRRFLLARDHAMPRLAPGLIRGRTECVPPRKPPIARSPGLPPQGHLALARPPEGRAPHARKRPSPSLDPSSRRLYHGAKFPPRQAKGAPG